MEFWKKIFEGFIAAIIVIFVVAYAYLAFRGRAILIEQLESFTGKKVTVTDFSVMPPLNIRIMGLKIDGLASVRSAYLDPSVPYLIIGRLALNKVVLIDPEFNIVKGEPAVKSASGEQVSEGISSKAVLNPGKMKEQIKTRIKTKFSSSVILKRLRIRGGRVNFIDHSVGKDGITITVKDVNFKLNDLYVFPSSSVTDFDLKGSIPWKKGHGDGKISLGGWVNFSKRDIDAKLGVSNIDGVYLQPYYSTWIDVEKARIEKADLNFSSRITGKDNNVTAACHLELTDIVRKPSEDEGEADKTATFVLNMFKALDQNKVVLDFTIRTKMDRPEFGFGNIKMAFQEKLIQARKNNGFTAQDLITLPGKILEITARGAGDASKAIVDGTVSVGRKLKKAAESVFNKPVNTPKK